MNGQLSTNEHLALALIAAGRTNRDLAKRFRLSASGTDRMVHRILTKLDAANRANAVHEAWRRGLLRGES